VFFTLFLLFLRVLPAIAMAEVKLLLKSSSDQAKQKLIKEGADSLPITDNDMTRFWITLKQGVGRLIRDVSDRGVLVIGDNRLVSRPYGEVFLKSLPPMRRSRDLGEAIEFLKLIHGDNSETSGA